MSDVELRFYEKNDEVDWDNFVLRSHKSTFQQTRRFLNYHKQRFKDRSVVVIKNGKLIGVIPAAQHPKDEEIIVSHIGATYGGLITDSSIYGEALIDVFNLLVSFYRNEGYKKLVYKSTPSLYHSTIDEDELYALNRISAVLNRVDINAVIDVDNRLKKSSQRKRSLKKADKSKVFIETGFENLDEFYSILESNLEAKHSAKPVHSLKELIELKALFDETLDLVVTKNEIGEVISGVLFFNINHVCHAQYIASSTEGYDVGGLDYLFENKINSLMKEGRRYLAFGTSNEDEGRILNQTLYRFKRQFGAGSVSHLSYILDL